MLRGCQAAAGLNPTAGRAASKAQSCRPASAWRRLLSAAAATAAASSVLLATECTCLDAQRHQPHHWRLPPERHRCPAAGATAQRLVGMLLPQAASGQVLREIEADERRRLQAQADAELAALSASNLQEEGWTWGNPSADATGSHTFSGLPPVQSGAGGASQEFYESSTYSGRGTPLSPQQPGQYAAPLVGQPAPGGHVAAQPTGQQWQQWQSAPIVSGNRPLHITLKQ